MGAQLRELLAELGLDDSNDIDVDDASERMEEQLDDSVERRLLLRFESSASGPWSGDEVSEWWLLSRPGEGAYIWWPDEVSGIGSGRFIDEDASVADAVQGWLAHRLDEQGWSLNQFVGVEITNFAPDILPRAFFLRLLEEAARRHPLALHELDTEAQTLEELLEEGYRESR